MRNVQKTIAAGLMVAFAGTAAHAQNYPQGQGGGLSPREQKEVLNLFGQFFGAVVGEIQKSGEHDCRMEEERMRWQMQQKPLQNYGTMPPNCQQQDVWFRDPNNGNLVYGGLQMVCR